MFFRREGNMFILESGYSSLYKRIVYLAPVETVINTIIEYDIKSAGFSALKKDKLVHDLVIERLEALPKEERNKAIGLMIRKNKDIGKAIQKRVTETRRQFFEANKIEEYEVLSIKNDAVFIIGRKMKHLEFDGLNFSEKNKYSSYHHFDGIEMYYSKRDERIDIKGVNDKILEDHEEYMLSFLAQCFTYIEKGMEDKLRDYLIEFSNDYKSKKLHPGYYRELSVRNYYRSLDSIFDGISDMVIVTTECAESELYDINISYNYLTYVLPLIQRYL